MPLQLHKSTGRSRIARGITIAETMVALAVLGVVLLLLGQLGVATAGYRQRSEAQRHAAQATHNLAERLMAWPIADLTAEKAAALEEPEGDVRFKVVIDDGPDGESLTSKRVRIRGEHCRVANVACELLFWRHAAEGQAK